MPGRTDFRGPRLDLESLFVPEIWKTYPLLSETARQIQSLHATGARITVQPIRAMQVKRERLDSSNSCHCHQSHQISRGAGGLHVDGF